MSQSPTRSEPVDFWTQRAEEYGARAVDMRISAGGFSKWTAAHWDVMADIIRPRLWMPMKWVLDYGCGAGRFSERLGKLTGAHVMAYDPCKTLIDLAWRAPNVTYGSNPLSVWKLAGMVDLVFCAYVLGGLSDEDAQRSICEMADTLRPDGIVFLAENSAQDIESTHWRSRSPELYGRLFANVGIKLQREGVHMSPGCEISLYIGRKV